MTSLAILVTLVVFFGACATERKDAALGSDDNEEESRDVMSILKRTFADFQDDTRRRRSADADLSRPLNDAEDNMIKRAFNLKEILADLKQETRKRRSHDADLPGEGSGSNANLDKRTLKQMLDDLTHEQKRSDAELETGSGFEVEDKRTWNLNEMLDDLQQNTRKRSLIELGVGSGSDDEKRTFNSNQAERRSNLDESSGSDAGKRTLNSNLMPDLDNESPSKRGLDEGSGDSSSSEELVSLEKDFRRKRQITALANLEVAADDSNTNLTMKADQVSVETVAVHIAEDEAVEIAANTRQIFIVQPLLMAQTGRSGKANKPTSIFSERIQAKMSKLASSENRPFVERHYNIVVVLSILGTLVALAMFVALFYCVTHLSPRVASRAITTTKA